MAIHAIRNPDLSGLHTTCDIEQVELASLLGDPLQLFRAGLGDRFGQRLTGACFSQ
jgi:hypothetical protein